jgi:hypothetical protein
VIINVKEGETLDEFVKRVRRTLPQGIPPSPPGWDELMDRKDDVPEEEKQDEENGDS